MATPVNISQALAGKTFFKGRTPDNDDEAEAAFAELGAINNGQIFAGSYQGFTAWERHGNGDELVQVIDGMTEITILTDDGAETHELTAGSFIVVPQGLWHRFNTPDGVTVMTATPMPTDHSNADDPRVG